MSQRIVVLPGDGIGPEVTSSAVEVLQFCAKAGGLDLEIQEFKVGGAAIAEYGQPLTKEVLDASLSSGVVLLGAVGDPRFDHLPAHQRPEKALLTLRKELELFANLRPIQTYPELVDASTLKPEIITGVDILIVRELTGGIYFGEPRGLETRAGSRTGYNTEIYHDYEIDRIARVAFGAARLRRRRVDSVDKSNVLESSQVWRAVVNEVAAEYSDVELGHILIDNCAMQLVSRPRSFDVLLANNMFGDILSDEAAMLTGSIGMLPSASIGAESAGLRTGMYEPVHGSAPDIAGKGIANPLATIGSVALLLRFSLGRDDLAGRIERAIAGVLSDGLRTADLARSGPAGREPVGTRAMTDAVLARLEHS